MSKPSSSNASTWLIAVACFALAAVAVWYLNQGYGKTSEKGYEFATALFAACGRQDEAKLKQIRSMIEDASEADELPPTDRDILLRIVSLAENGRWTTAQGEVRKLMEAQLEPVD